MDRFPAWFGAGLVAAGVVAGMLGGAAVAGADDGAPSESTSSTSAGADKPGATDAKDTNDAKDVEDTEDAEDVEDTEDAEDGEGTPAGGPAKATTTPSSTTDDPDAGSAPPDEPAVGQSHDAPISRPATDSDRTTPARATSPSASEPAPPRPVVASSVTASPPPESLSEARSVQPQAILDVRTTAALRSVEIVETTTAVAPPRPTVVGFLSGLLFNLLQAVERLVTGPPVVPPGSTVTVRSATLQIGGRSVPADWYYPAGDPPERMILLQHGFFAIGPMYSYTAARLAERTNSIVVAPTLTSNPLADGGLWLGGAGMHQAVADLFAGDRGALTASALAAGYAAQYGLDPAQAALPQQFALAGHSLGGALVSAVAGYLADNGAAKDLAGVILFDGVPTGDQLSGALVKLAAFEERTGHYVPVRAIGAPPNFYNFIGNANQSLAAARPDNYNGVVLAGGVHMDSMQGGNPLIQFVAYLAAGFPQKQNPPAVQSLAATWLGQWFAGDTHIGDRGDAGYLAPGSSLQIDTPRGTARGVVIGPPVAVASAVDTRLLAA